MAIGENHINSIQTNGPEDLDDPPAEKMLPTDWSEAEVLARTSIEHDRESRKIHSEICQLEPANTDLTAIKPVKEAASLESPTLRNHSEDTATVPQPEEVTCIQQSVLGSPIQLEHFIGHSSSRENPINSDEEPELITGTTFSPGESTPKSAGEVRSPASAIIEECKNIVPVSFQGLSASKHTVVQNEPTRTFPTTNGTPIGQSLAIQISHGSNEEQQLRTMSKGEGTEEDDPILEEPNWPVPEKHDGDGFKTAEKIEGTQPVQNQINVPAHLFQPANNDRGPEANGDVVRQTFPPRERNRFPQGPRFLLSNRTYRGDNNSAEVARLEDENMDLKHELKAEHKRNTDLRRVIYNEIQSKLEAAMNIMMTDLLRKQIQTFEHDVDNSAKARELKRREAQIHQLEIFLSAGATQLYRKLKEIGHATPTDAAVAKTSLSAEIMPSLADVEREHIRAEAELSAKYRYIDAHAEFDIRTRDLAIRESHLQMREQQYKALLYASFEFELQKTTLAGFEARLADVAAKQYRCGFEAGKASRWEEAKQEAEKLSFLRGYAAYHKSQIAVSRFRSGELAMDSEEVSFLFDAAHPLNPVNIGKEVGRMQIGETMEGLESGGGEVVKSGGMKRKKKRVVNGVSAAENDDQNEEVTDPDGDEGNENEKNEILAVKPVSSPKTFAAQLRGPRAMYNGHHIFANHVVTPDDAVTSENEICRTTGITITENGECEKADLIDL